MKIRSVRGPICSMRTKERTNMHEEGNARFPQFGERTERLVLMANIEQHLLVQCIINTTNARYGLVEIPDHESSN